MSEFRKSWIVFAFGRSGDGYTYYELKNPEEVPFEEQQKTSLVNGHAVRPRNFDSKLFKSQSIGAIFEVSLSDAQISYNSGQKPMFHWFNTDDRTTWRLKQATIDGMAKAKKEGARNDLSELLEPVRAEYIKSRSREERRFIIAEVIRLITHGTV